MTTAQLHIGDASDTEEFLLIWSSQLETLARGIAHDVTQRGWWVNEHDLLHELYEWAWRQRTALYSRLAEGDQETVRGLLKRVANDTERERAAKAFPDWVRVGPATVEELLASFFDKESWFDPAESPDVGTGTTGTNTSHERHTRAAALADLSVAYDALNTGEKQLLVLYFGLHWTYDEIAEVTGRSANALTVQKSRILRKLAKRMTGEPAAR